MSAGEGTFTPFPLLHRPASDAALARHDCTACQVRQVLAYYEVDDDSSKHALSLTTFGEEKEWVLLDKA